MGTFVRATRVDHAFENIHNINEAFPWEADVSMKLLKEAFPECVVRTSPKAIIFM